MLQPAVHLGDQVSRSFISIPAVSLIGHDADADRRRRHLCRGRLALVPPDTATGTIGACAFSATGSRPSERQHRRSLRVLVKMRTVAVGSNGRRPRAIASPIVAPLDRHEAAALKRTREQRIALISVMQTMLIEGEGGEQDRRIDIALMVGAIAARSSRQMLGAVDPT
jgi:hypothetical protein